MDPDEMEFIALRKTIIDGFDRNARTFYTVENLLIIYWCG
jgi:hypothetical protein